jgi:uncharacterized membrane protein YphA (DoxX/SURF4 family)
MSAVSLVASLLLGAAFVLAGGSKLAAGVAWEVQARDLGAPRFAARPLPWIELAVGASLIAQLASPLPALCALGLLVAFSVLIAMRLADGRRPACACFGAWSATPIGPRHLVRNAVLASLAVLSFAG